MERIIVYEQQRQIKEEQDLEILRCLLEKKSVAIMPEPIENLIIEVDIIEHGIVIQVVNHSALSIFKGYLSYGSDWDKDQAMEIANVGLQISGEREKYAKRIDKPFIKAMNRMSKKLVWSDSDLQNDNGENEKETVGETSPKVAIATIMTA